MGSVNITVNKNSVPNDPASPFVTSGIRIGTPAVTTRGFKKEEVNDLLVKGLNSQGDEVPNWDLQIFGPAGGVLSNAEDMAKFIIAQFDERDKELKEEIKQLEKLYKK